MKRHGHHSRLIVSAGTDSADYESSSPGRPANEIERSLLVNEDTVYLIFQMDLDTQLQRCLNYEAYDDAQEVRKKRQRVSKRCLPARIVNTKQGTLALWLLLEPNV